MNEDARVLTWDELWTVMPFVVWREDKGPGTLEPLACIRGVYLGRTPEEEPVTFEVENFRAYGKKFRCWTGRPTEEQRAAAGWR